MVAILKCSHVGAKAKRGAGKSFRGKGLAKKRKRGAGKSFRGKGFANIFNKLKNVGKVMSYDKPKLAKVYAQKTGMSGWSKYLGGARAKVKC